MEPGNKDIAPSGKDNSPDTMQNPSLLQQVKPYTLADILGMPYHQLALFHLDSQQSLPDTSSFDMSVRIRTANDFKNDPLPIDQDLSWDTIQRFGLFRFWVAINRFPTELETIQAQYISVVGGLNFFFRELSPFDELTKSLKRCHFLHLTRGLLEDKETVMRTIQSLPSALSILSDSTVESLRMIEKTNYALKKIIQAPIFSRAIERFAAVLGKELTLDDLNAISEELNKLELVSIQATLGFVAGIVLPGGLGLNIGIIRTFSGKGTEKTTNLIKELKDRGEFREAEVLQAQETERFEKQFLSASLWIALHELGHLIVRTKAISSPFFFGKITPPTQVQEAGVDYENLEGGPLFSSIFLGAFAKEIWRSPELMRRLFAPETITTLPVFNVQELANIPQAKVLSIRNSGSFSIEFIGYEALTF